MFTAWHPDGPNGFDQSCATTDNRGEWNDESCTAYFPPVCYFGEYHLLPPVCYRSGTVNSNTVNSKFHLIRSYCKYLARILSFHV